ncbi:MAG: tyrosine-type recombinase/integrase [Dehalococcoidia bacterium]|nr:tyrosine-type recombinase/integrase [Dehalococcoidia bacterium]
MVTTRHLDAYLRHLADDLRRATSTIAGYEAELRLLLARQVALEPETIAAFITRTEDGELLAPTTRNRRLAIVRGFTRYLVAQGALATDPTASIARAKVPADREAALTVDELSQVVAVVVRSSTGALRIRDLSLVLLLFYTGLRVSELLRLDVDQVDLDAGLLRRATRKGGGATDVVLHPCAAEALRAWLQVRPSSGGGLFPRGNSTLTVRAVQKRLRALGLAAGLGTRLHPHALRHAHATALLRCGISTELIRQSLNHTSLQTTQRYLHGDLGMVRAAIGQLPDLLPR